MTARIVIALVIAGVVSSIAAAMFRAWSIMLGLFSTAVACALLRWVATPEPPDAPD